MATFKDVTTLINYLVKEAKGSISIAERDVTDIASLGDKVVSSLGSSSLDIVFGKLLDRIGKTIIDNKAYKGKFDYLFKDAFEYGCILQKIHIDSFEAVTSATYNDLDNGDVDGDLFKIFLPSVTQTLFEDAEPWEFRVTITRKQVKTAFTDATTFTAFINGIYLAMETSINKYMETNGRAVIERFIAEKFNAQANEDIAGVHAINVLQSYYDEVGKELTPTTCQYDADFLRWCGSEFLDKKNLFAELTTIYNVAGYDRFTEGGELIFNIISKFADNMARFMESDIYHEEMVKSPAYHPITYWQGLGTAGAIADRMNVKVKVKNPSYEVGGEEPEYLQTDKLVIGIMYDTEAIGITVKDRETVTVPNPHKHTENMWEQGMMCNFVDLTQNGVVFYLDTVVKPQS